MSDSADSSNNKRRPPPKKRPPQGGRAARDGAYGASELRQQQVTAAQMGLTELNVEEVIQQEKLSAAVEIEQNMNDVKQTYQEFDALLKQQGQKLDQVEQNVDKSNERVTQGVGELQRANSLQKSSRKKMFCVIALLLIIIAVIVVIVLVVTK